MDALDAVVSELAHPFGSHAFIEPIARRAQLPVRETVMYGDENEDGSEEVLQAMEAAFDSDSGEGETVSAPAAAAVANGTYSTLAQGAGKRKRPIVKSVQLPNWMDLDQDTVPHGGPVVALVDTATKKTAKATMPHKLEDFGGVGELTVQLRTSAPERPFDEMLQRHVREQSGQVDRMERERELPPGYVCNRCQQPGHWITACPQKVPRTVARPAVPPPESKYICKLCAVAGHWVDCCPTLAVAPEAHESATEKSACKGTGGSSRGRGRGRGRSLGGSGDSSGGGGGSGASGVVSEGIALAADEDDGQEAKRARKNFGKPSAGYVCNACHGTGHWLQQCPRYKEYKEKAPPPGYVCKQCNQAGHWKELCTSVPRWKEHSASDGRPPASEEALVVSAAARDAGEDICDALDEETQEVLVAVQRAVQVLGETLARMLLVQTWQIEDTGGMLTLDGTNRRRTAGGVYLWLVKQKLNDAQRAQIFPPRPKAQAAKPMDM